MAAERRFHAMGSDAHVIVVGGPDGLADELERMVAELEQRWSRFLSTSEVSRLNDLAGTPVAVHPQTRLLVARAVEAWHITGGSFDPTVLGAVVRAGYDTSLDGRLDGRAGARTAGASDLVVACTDITVDHAGGRVRLPAGTGFDPGGIGKGLAADLVAEAAVAAGATGVCVNLGGDLRVTGCAPNGGSWNVAVEHPTRDAPLAVLDVASGAVATSTTLRRRWTVDGVHRHHLVDPRSGEPSTSDLELVTVIAGAGWHAEVLATASMLRGADRAFDLLTPGTHALAVTTAGSVLASDGLAPFLRRQVTG